MQVATFLNTAVMDRLGISPVSWGRIEFIHSRNSADGYRTPLQVQYLRPRRSTCQ
jgi:hypothetical protein